MGYGVIGSPTGSGPVSLGSSPGTPAVGASGSLCTVRPAPSEQISECRVFSRPAPLCSGLARRPLKAVARVRIPSGLRAQGVGECSCRAHHSGRMEPSRCFGESFQRPGNADCSHHFASFVAHRCRH